MIEAESGGLLEFIQSRFDLSMLAGLDAAKKKLRDAATALRVGRFDVLPMGYVISGPVGTGKTFLTTCFAGEVGIPAVMLKNFRSMWQGSTEANLERVLTLLKAMSPIAVVVDEADAQRSDRNNSGDSGVGNRAFAPIAQFMGNTELRGKVIWFPLTCRPDLIPVDLKRQGRAEEHIALFYPRTDDERLAMLRAMQKKTGTRVASEEAEKFFLANAGMLSGADTEAILVRARMKSAIEGDSTLDVDDLKATIADFIPPSYPDEIELQNLVAVLECTSRGLLSEEYSKMDRGEIQLRPPFMRSPLAVSLPHFKDRHEFRNNCPGRQECQWTVTEPRSAFYFCTVISTPACVDTPLMAAIIGWSPSASDGGTVRLI